MDEFMLPCLTKSFLGFDCPGCGGQRSLWLLVQGNFSEAFFMYPPIYPLVMLGGLVVINKFLPLKKYSFFVSVLAAISVASIIINYIYKLTY